MPTEKEQKLKKIKDIFKIIDDGISKAEFLKSFKSVIAQITKLEQQLIARASIVSEKLKTDVNNKLATVKDGERGERGIDGLKGDRGDIGEKGESGDRGDKGEGGKDIDPKQVKKIQKQIDKLKKRIKELKKMKGKVVYTGSAGAELGGHVRYYDLSSQLDSSTKTFSLPAFARVLQVISSSFPNALRPDIDYSVNGSNFTITFTDEISANTTLATNQSILILYATQ